MYLCELCKAWGMIVDVIGGRSGVRFRYVEVGCVSDYDSLYHFLSPDE